MLEHGCAGQFTTPRDVPPPYQAQLYQYHIFLPLPRPMPHDRSSSRHTVFSFAANGLLPNGKQIATAL